VVDGKLLWLLVCGLQGRFESLLQQAAMQSGGRFHMLGVISVTMHSIVVLSDVLVLLQPLCQQP